MRRLALVAALALGGCAGGALPNEPPPIVFPDDCGREGQPCCAPETGVPECMDDWTGGPMGCGRDLCRQHEHPSQ